ncbi:MAG: anti-sigma factor [Acidimicrobiia bacterium]
MNFPNDDDVHLLASLYTVDALDDIERRRFERHLDNCETCRADVDGFRRAAAGLTAAAAIAPPPALKDRVLADVARSRQVSVASRPSAGVRHVVRRALAVAAAVVTALSGALALHERSVARDATAAAAIARAADTQIVRFAPDTSGTAQLMFAPSVGAAILVTDGVAAPADGRTYQLWAIEAGTPRSLGTFTPSGERGELRVKESPKPGTVLAVTDEPDGGSPQPTTTPFLASEPI